MKNLIFTILFLLNVTNLVAQKSIKNVLIAKLIEGASTNYNGFGLCCGYTTIDYEHPSNDYVIYMDQDYYVNITDISTLAETTILDTHSSATDNTTSNNIGYGIRYNLFDSFQGDFDLTSYFEARKTSFALGEYNIRNYIVDDEPNSSLQLVIAELLIILNQDFEDSRNNNQQGTISIDERFSFFSSNDACLEGVAFSIDNGVTWQNALLSQSLSDFGLIEQDLEGKQIIFKGIACGCSYTPIFFNSPITLDDNGFFPLSFSVDNQIFFSDIEYTDPNYNVTLTFQKYSPQIEELTPQDETCSFNGDGELTVTFDRVNTDGLHMLANVRHWTGNRENLGEIVGGDYRIYNEDAPLSETGNALSESNKSYTFKDIPAPVLDPNQEYVIVYASRDNGDNSEILQSETFEMSEPFTIGEPSEVTVTPTPIQPQCAGQKASITAVAADGNDVGSAREHGYYEFLLIKINIGMDDEIIEGGWIEGEPASPNIYTFNNLDPGFYDVYTRLRLDGLESECETRKPDESIEILAPPTDFVFSNNNTGDPTFIKPSYPNATDGQITVYFEEGVPEFTATLINQDPDSPSAINGEVDETLKEITFEGLGTGTYIVSLEDNNCTIESLEIELEDPNPIIIDGIDREDIECFDSTDGELTAQVSGGDTTNYFYRWTKAEDQDFNESSQRITGLDKGNYTLRVATSQGNLGSDDSNAYVEQTISIGDGLTPVEINNVAIENARCINDQGRITFNVSEGTVPDNANEGEGYSYSIGLNGPVTFAELTYNTTDNVHEIFVDSYTVGNIYIRDANNCQTQTADQITVEFPDDALTLSYIDQSQVNNTIYQGNEGSFQLQLYGGYGGYTYAFTKDDEDIDTPAFNYIETNATLEVTNLESGTYTVTVTDAEGCEVTLIPSIQITEPEEFTIGDITIDSPITCINGTATLSITASGGLDDNYNYEWFYNNDNLNNDNAVLENAEPGQYIVTVTDENAAPLTSSVFSLVEPTIVAFTATPNPIKCHGDSTGSIAIQDLSGGHNTGNYEYALDNIEGPYTALTVTGTTSIIENLEAGTYQLWIKDSNLCDSEASQIVTITQPDAIDIEEIEKVNASATNASDGRINIDVTGGTAPYAYSWTSENDPSFSESTQDLENLPIDTYYLVITDAEGCIKEYEREITLPGALIIRNVEVIDTICHDTCTGAVTFDIEGGLSPYAFAWTIGSNPALNWENGAAAQSINNVCPGTYTLEVTDRVGASTSTEITIENAAILEVILPEDITLCQEQTAIIDGTQPNVETYNWTSSNGFVSDDAIISVTETGIYELNITTPEGCLASNSIYVEATNTVISSDFIAASQVFVGESFILVNIADPLPDSSQWHMPDEATVTSQDDTYLELYFDTPGTYQVRFSVDLGLCYEETIKEVIVLERTEDDTDVATGALESFIKPKMYPNPISYEGTLNIEIETSEQVPVHISVYSASSGGVLIQRSTTAALEHKENFDISRFAAGLYFVVLETRLGDQVLKLIKS